MQSGELTSGDVTQWETTILVNGVPREADAWSVSRELQGDLPAQVSLVSGVSQATGSITWSATSDVEGRPVNPWAPIGWVPVRGDRVEIFIGDGSTEWKQFHGVIDDVTGSIGEGFESTIIDDWDKLSRTMNQAALLRIMPPALGGGDPYRYVGLNPTYFIDRAFRTGNFETMPLDFGSTLTVPGQGSIWPLRGVLLRNNVLITPQPHPAPWGYTLSNLSAYYQVGGGHDNTEPLQLTIQAAQDHAGLAYTRAFYGEPSATSYAQISVNSSRTAQVYVNGTLITSIAMGEGNIACALFIDGEVRLGVEGTVQVNSAPVTLPTGVVSQVQIYADENARAGGWQVSHPTREIDYLRPTKFVPTAVIDTTSTAYLGYLDASPTIEERTGESVLQEISQAILGAVWIDELGVLQYVPSPTLVDRASVRELTTLDDITNLDWQAALQRTASRVTAVGKVPNITRSRWDTTTLAQGSGSDVIKENSEMEIFLEPESDEDWVDPRYTFLEVGSGVDIWGSANNPEFSLTGLYATEDGGETEIAPVPLTITTAQLGLQKALVKYVSGNWSAATEGVLATSETNTILFPKNRGIGLPRLQGGALIKWRDIRVVGVGPGGPGPEMVHEVGYWVNRQDDTTLLTRIANYLTGVTSVPAPSVRGMGIIPDPRLQLGDVVTVTSEILNLTMDALITSVDWDVDDSGPTMSVGVRVLNTSRLGETYREFNDSDPQGIRYSEFNDLAPTPQTYAEFNNEGIN